MIALQKGHTLCTLDVNAHIVRLVQDSGQVKSAKSTAEAQRQRVWEDDENSESRQRRTYPLIKVKQFVVRLNQRAILFDWK